MKATLAVGVVFLSCFAFAQRAAHKPPQQRAPANHPQNAVSKEDRDAIEELHQDDITASLALDVEKLASLWDDEVVALPPNSRPIVGKQANRAWLEKSAAALKGTDILGYEEHWDEVRVIGDFAYEYGTIESRMRPSSSTKPADEVAQTFNVMRVLKKQPEGTWKIYRTIWNDQAPLPLPKEKP